MTCPSCGTDNDAAANFCRRCGERLQGPDRTEAIDREALAPGDAQAAVAATATDTAPDPDDDTGQDDDATDPDAVPVPGPPPGAEDLRLCPRCGSANSPRRVLCGRCGADLDTGQAVAARPRSEARVVPAEDPRPPRPRAVRWTVLAIVTAGLILGGGLGAMVALGVGPFADDAEGPPAATFDADAYPEDPRDLVAGGLEVGASTRHEPVGDRVFEPSLMFDGELETAWNNSGETNPQGIGERIVVDLPEPVWLTEIIIGNGDQRDDARYLGNARVQQARVALDAGESFTITLEDLQGRQVVRLPVPRLTTGLTIVVTEVYPGDTYPDLALSELGFRGHPATGDDVDLAERRARFPRRLPET